MQENTNPEGARPLRLGANYTPSRGWFHSWQDFDADEVRRDLESIAKLGLDHIRVFPLWPDLQPSRTLIRHKAVADVGTVVDVATEFGLDASVDVLQGHLSSFDFLPAWVGTWHRRPAEPTSIPSTTRPCSTRTCPSLRGMRLPWATSAPCTPGCSAVPASCRPGPPGLGAGSRRTGPVGRRRGRCGFRNGHGPEPCRQPEPVGHYVVVLA